MTEPQMPTPSTQRPMLTDQQAIRLWAVYIKRWGELLHDKVMADADRCATLEPLDQAYLRAFWQATTGKLQRINTIPLPVPQTTQEELALAWKTICIESGWPIDQDALASDVEQRLDFLKSKLAHEFEKSVLQYILRYEISSPIEQIFLMHWEYQRIEYLHGLKLSPQERVDTGRGKFAVDFVVTRKNGESARVAVELDGHEFHEKTAQQVAKDKSRERAIVATGIPVLRFSGSEVFKSPRKVIAEIIEYFNRLTT